MSGERRSWLTERSTAVLAASLRLNVSASSALARSPSRSRATARSDGQRRQEPGRRPRIDGRAGGKEEPSDVPASGLEVEGRLVRARPAARVELDPSSDHSQGAGRIVGDDRDLAWDVFRLQQRSRGTGEPLASRSRCSASAARRRARAASSLTTIAVKRYTASATQFSESCSDSVCAGGRKNQLKASMLSTDTPTA